MKIGSLVTVTIDRPLGSSHPEHPNMIYSINYGYIKDTLSPDGEEFDAYVLGVDVPVSEFSGRVVAIIHRKDDIEDKLVIAPLGMEFTMEVIINETYFQEKYFKSTVEM